MHSIETTSTERHQLANAMVNHRRDLERYTDLPSLEALEQQHKPRKVAVKKQVFILFCVVRYLIVRRLTRTGCDEKLSLH